MSFDKKQPDSSLSLAGEHKPVMLNEAINLLNVRTDLLYVDATAGAGGHLRKICEIAGSGKNIIALDQDQAALQQARINTDKLADEIRFVNANFGNIKRVLSGIDVHTVNGGILADLGVSSMQLDNGQRGFSFMHDGPLDMRMDSSKPMTAEDLVNNLTEIELANIIYQYGEERYSRRIAKAIINNRPIKTTLQLANIVESAIGWNTRSSKINPATRTFQALRIAVNNELDNLKTFLEQASELLVPGARLVIITFHSLEDRIVKQFFKLMASKCICPPRQPICNCGKKPEALIINSKPIIASEQEILANIRSRSAKLRAVEKLY